MWDHRLRERLDLRLRELAERLVKPGANVSASECVEISQGLIKFLDKAMLTPTDTVPIAMRLPCPICGVLHIDTGEFETKPHHTHACQNCGNVWRPAIVSTVGVQFLPGFKNT